MSLTEQVKVWKDKALSGDYTLSDAKEWVIHLRAGRAKMALSAEAKAPSTVKGKKTALGSSLLEDFKNQMNGETE